MSIKVARILICCAVFCANACLAGEVLKIGVLAKRGPVKALQMWNATGEHLSRALGDKKIKIIPLDFEAVDPAIKNSDVDFFLVNSSMFITAKIKYGASAIATMVNSRNGNPLTSFGGVIITSAENEKINTLADLKGKRFMAVKETSFGGWQMAFKEIIDSGIDPEKDFAELIFIGNHDNVALAVQNEAVDAGTLRTDTLERMQVEGIIDMEDLKVIAKKDHVGFPFVCSTKLYPEWPLAKVKSTSDKIAQEVVSALKLLKSSDRAAKDAKIVGWVDPLDYSPVEELQKALKVGAYAAQ